MGITYWVLVIGYPLSVSSPIYWVLGICCQVMGISKQVMVSVIGYWVSVIGWVLVIVYGMWYCGTGYVVSGIGYDKMIRPLGVAELQRDDPVGNPFISPVSLST